jgi:hypothetical protein
VARVDPRGLCFGPFVLYCGYEAIFWGTLAAESAFSYFTGYISPTSVAGEAATGGQCPAIVQYAPINSGPLAEDIANTFRSGTYTSRILDGDEIFYRVISEGGDPAGRFWTASEPSGPLQSVIDSALDQSWVLRNSATQLVTVRVPGGTIVYEGFAAPQGSLAGGGNQVYIPRVNSSWIAP